MYDVYRHVERTDLQLILRRGSKLPARVSTTRWQLAARRLEIPQVVADEIDRSGFSVIRLARHTISSGRLS